LKADGSVPACASGFVTVTATTPGRLAGMVATISVAVALSTTANWPPNSTLGLAGVAEKLEPAMVTVVPPLVPPAAGVTASTDGGRGPAWYVKARPFETWPSAFVTVTVTGPGGAGGLRTVAEVVDCVTTGASTAPNLTTRGGENSVPVSVTEPPPEVEPTAAESRVSAGGARVGGGTEVMLGGWGPLPAPPPPQAASRSAASTAARQASDERKADRVTRPTV
jgi:hypothetical protein